MTAVRYNVDVTTAALASVAVLAGVYVWWRWDDLKALPGQAAQGAADFAAYGTPLQTEEKPPGWFAWYPDHWYGSLEDFADRVEAKEAAERAEADKDATDPWWRFW